MTHGKNQGRPNRTFADFVGAEQDFECVMSLVHTTDFLRLGGIQVKGYLEPQKDPNFNDDKVVCFFYGRPSYRVHPNVSNTNVSSFAPVCFVMKRQFIWAAKRMHAFDTGAFVNNFLARFIHPDLKLKDFQLDPKEDQAQRLASVFYGSNSRYMDCIPKGTLDPSTYAAQRMHAVEAYSRLLGDTRNDKSDERVHSVEVQLDRQVELANNVEAIVVPARLFDEEQRREIEADWKCKVVCYHMKAVFTPREMMDLIFDKVREVLVQDGQIS